MPTALRAVSLDLDNTLWDTPPVLARAEASLAAWLVRNLPLLAERYPPAELAAQRQALARAQPERAHDLSWLRTEVLRRAALAVGYPAAVAHTAFEVFIAARNEIEPYPEVRGALARLAARVPLYALTNGNACVRRVGLGAYFRGALGAAEAGAAKPDARIYARLLALAGVVPAEMLHVGDDAEADVDGARAAGIGTVWINRAGGVWPARLAAPDHVVHDLL
jgi:FMN hydrolase / 5-amino-6-(5-phospho-D-ribitylamino)uracil phosphatase